MKDANYPWLLLVPMKNDLVEIIDLRDSEQAQLMREISMVSAVLRSATNCEKLNIGALGNQVSQLHIHVIGRFREDTAWPGPVWGAVPSKPYEKDKEHALIEELKIAFSEYQKT